MAMTAPVISGVELSAFHASHFSATSTSDFAAEFLGPVEAGEHNAYYDEEGDEEAEDDGLGYYADGVKRTLTDEQIAIFMHSEIEALLRERRHVEEAKDDASEGEVHEDIPTPILEPAQQSQPVAEPLRPIIGPILPTTLEDDEMDDYTPESASAMGSAGGKTAQTSNKSKKQKKKERQERGQQRDREPKPKGFFRQNVKPDLRKRTWDVVDKGVDGLDYDDMEGGGAAQPSIAKRRQISYDD